MSVFLAPAPAPAPAPVPVPVLPPVPFPDGSSGSPVRLSDGPIAGPVTGPVQDWGVYADKDTSPDPGKVAGGVIGAFVGIIILFCAIARMGSGCKNEDKDKEAEEVTELAKKLRELMNSYRNQHATVVDIEAGLHLDKQTVEKFIDHMLEEKPTRFSSQFLQMFTSNYSTKLGEGAFGAVYKGYLSDGQLVAVKVLNNNGMDKRIEEQFMAEVNTIGRTYHRNLVKLYGFCFEPKVKALVYEYMENGSLDKFLFEKKDNDIEWEKLYQIAVGAARGLEYLHHFSQRRIIHYDIKPANVLLDSNFCPKIADFGLAKLCIRDTTNLTMSRVGGTPGYAAPEVYMPFPLSYKCDVYSFGIMLFEIVGRKRNFDVNLLDENQKWFPKQVWENFDKGELEELFGSCRIEAKDMEKAKTMVTVALWCVQYLPEARPSMRNIVKILEGGATATTPPNPFQHLMSSTNVPSCFGTNSTDYDEDDHTNDTSIMRKYDIHYATS